MKLKPVLVEWEDAAGGAPRWEPAAVAARRKPVLALTAGFLLKRTKKRIVVALTLAEDGDCFGTMAIPASWVVRVRELR